MNFDLLFEKLEKYVKISNAPVIELENLNNKEPFKVLISTIISLRTKDRVTIASCKRLFPKLTKPSDIFNFSQQEIESLIYPAGFYRIKAKNMIEMCKILAEKYNNQVPNNYDILCSFNGIGSKTANLVLSQGFDIDAICVDIHVFRISNRLGLVKTKNPIETEKELEKVLPKKYWKRYNFLLVALGQTICTPKKPKCNICPISNLCKKVI